MITAEQIQIVLNHAAKAPTTLGQAMQDGQAVAAMVQFGNALAAGQVKIVPVDPALPQS